MSVLVIDVGGTHVKLLMTGQTEPVLLDSGPKLTPSQMLRAVQSATVGWEYDAIAIGIPSPVMHGQVLREPDNLGAGWVGFDFPAAPRFPRRQRLRLPRGFPAVGRLAHFHRDLSTLAARSDTLHTMTLPLASRLGPLLATSLFLLGGCRGTFEPDVTGPITPPPPPAVVPRLPFRVGAFGPDYATGVAVDGFNSAIVVSYFQGSVDFDPGSGAVVRTAIGPADGAVAKYRDDGSLAWVTNFGGTGADLPADIALTADGGVVVTGIFTSGTLCAGRPVTLVGARDAFLIKFSATGTCLWAVAIGGASDVDEGRDVFVEPNGDILVTGAFAGTVDFDPSAGVALLTSRGGTDAFVARYSADGAYKGVAQFGGLENDAGSSLTRTATGDVIVGGEFAGTATFGNGGSPLLLISAGESDFFLAQLAPSLGVQWAVRGGGPGAEYLAHNSLLIEPGGTLVVAGMFSGTADLDGSAGSALVVSQGGTDVFLARFGVAGQYVGSGRRFGGAGSDGVQGLTIDAENNFYLSGWFSGSVDFDPGAGLTLRTAQGTGGAADAYLLAVTAAGDLRWVNTLGAVVGGDASVAIGSGLGLTSNGALWAVGRFFGRADLDPGVDAIFAQSLGDAEQFVVRVERSTGVLRRD